MKLAVCALEDVAEAARRHRPAAVVSLLAPEQTPPRFIDGGPHLVLRFHDIAAPHEGLTEPNAETVARLLAFGAECGARDTLLVHCWMGISRSPAAAFILACAAAARTPEEEIAQALRRAAPAATPNPLLVSLADSHLEREGRMVTAISRIGRGRETARGDPFELDTAVFAGSSRGVA